MSITPCEVTGNPRLGSVVIAVSESPTPTQTSSQAPLEQPSTPRTPRPTRRLPFGPFGMLAVTAIALVIAGLAAWGASSLFGSRNDSEAVDISEALDDVTYTPPADSGAMAKIGQPAPNVPLDMIGGDSTELAAIAGRGTPMLINFWSSTCVPCLKEMPALESVHADIGDQVIFLGINAQDKEAAAKKMISKTGVSYDNARDPDGSISTRFGALALPRTVLVDGDGKIVATHTGELTREKIVSLLSENNLPTP